MAIYVCIRINIMFEPLSPKDVKYFKGLGLSDPEIKQKARERQLERERDAFWQEYHESKPKPKPSAFVDKSLERPFSSKELKKVHVLNDADVIDRMQEAQNIDNERIWDKYERPIWDEYDLP